MAWHAELVLTRQDNRACTGRSLQLRLGMVPQQQLRQGGAGTYGSNAEKVEDGY